MFESKSIFEIVNMGGVTMYVLLACAVLVLAVIMERFFTYRKYAVDVRRFMAQVEEELHKGAAEAAIRLCIAKKVPAANVVWAGLEKAGAGTKVAEEAMYREILQETKDLERYTTIVGTIGKVAVYIGLFGTVLGIIRAFHNISVTQSGGFPVIIGGVAEALICTATGLLIAVPAVVAHNFFMRRVDALTADMQYCASMVLELLYAPGKTHEGP